KICNEFGEGFFYIPGTDTCLRLSGEVRADYRFQSDADTPGDFRVDNEDRVVDRIFNDRNEDRTFFRSRAQLKWDARTATEYGTLRSFVTLNANINSDAGQSSTTVVNQLGGTGTNNVTVDKAFIQFGGLTAGYAHTFFGIYDADYANNAFFTY